MLKNGSKLKSNVSSFTEEETIAFGKELGKVLKPNSLVCLFGELGAGKTTLSKGIACGVAAIDPEDVGSPTFVYLNIYKGKLTLYHFDLYRLNGVEEFLSLGFEEYFYSGGVCCIEWSERIASILPPHTITITLTHENEEHRKIYYEVPKCQIH